MDLGVGLVPHLFIIIPECPYPLLGRDLLLMAPSQELCLEETRCPLTELGELGYCASAKKAQICTQKGSHLGYMLKEGKR